MPRYYFHVIDGQFLVDSEGTECSGMAQVRSEAIRTAGAMLADMNGAFASGHEWQMHVTDEANKTVYRLRFSAQEATQGAEPLPPGAAGRPAEF
jgi:hypothetical protein